MYKKNRNIQTSLDDFNQPMGLKLNPDNQWIQKADMIPWDEIEDKYADLFPSKTGTVAKPLRMALGSLLIQKEFGFSDRVLVEQLQENPYFQYFIGLPGYQMEKPFVPSLLVEFRKRLNADVLNDINEMIIRYNKKDGGNGSSDGSGSGPDSGKDNNGTLILDATCAPQNIAFPTDLNLLNEAREKLEAMLDELCDEYNFYRLRTYRKQARKAYLAVAKSKKPSGKKIRKAIRKQLQYVRRDIGHVHRLTDENGCELSDKSKGLFSTIEKLYEQQNYMYQNHTHSVEDRIVSIVQPYVRPIVRGKAKAPVEFGAKLDLSIERGLGRIERISFDSFNESENLQPAIERYFERNGCYPERVLADKIYRNRANLQYCREHGIRLSGPSLGRRSSDYDHDLKTQYIDNADRVEVERAFSLTKRSYGLGCITTRLAETTLGSIVLSVIAMNIGKIARLSFWPKFISIFSRYLAMWIRPLEPSADLQPAY